MGLQLSTKPMLTLQCLTWVSLAHCMKSLSPKTFPQWERCLPGRLGLGVRLPLGAAFHHSTLEEALLKDIRWQISHRDFHEVTTLRSWKPRSQLSKIQLAEKQAFERQNKCWYLLLFLRVFVSNRCLQPNKLEIRCRKESSVALTQLYDSLRSD